MSVFPELKTARFMSLTTFKKAGTAVSTPVWFAQEGDKLFVYTLARSGKVKRIRNSGQVTIAPCTASGKVTGGVANGTARILSTDEGRHADAVLNKKYGIIKRALTFFNRIQGGQSVYLEIVAR